ncbi:hypothetical protein ACX9MO_13355 [Pseudooceanicola sp. 502str34]
MTGTTSKTKRAARKFEWLAAIRKNGVRDGVTRLDLWVALALLDWLDDDLTCYRAHADIGKDVGCSETSARASTARLRKAGFLSVSDAPKRTGKRPNGGRLATTYVLKFPDGFRKPACGNDEEVSATRGAETVGVEAKQEHGVSASQLTEVSASQIAAIPLEDPVESGSALGRAPAYSIDAVSISSDDVAIEAEGSPDDRGDGTQGPNAPVPDPLSQPLDPMSAAVSELAHALGDEDLAREVMRGSIMGLAGFDRGLRKSCAQNLRRITRGGQMAWGDLHAHIVAIVEANGGDGRAAAARAEADMVALDCEVDAVGDALGDLHAGLDGKQLAEAILSGVMHDDAAAFQWAAVAVLGAIQRGEPGTASASFNRHNELVSALIGADGAGQFMANVMAVKAARSGGEQRFILARGAKCNG